MQVLDVRLDPETPNKQYVEHVRTADLSVGVYSLPCGSVDGQLPHTEDEVYVVLSGSGRLWTPALDAEVSRGSVIFVPAGEPHRFYDIREDLHVAVIFGPAENTRRPQATSASAGQ